MAANANSAMLQRNAMTVRCFSGNADTSGEEVSLLIGPSATAIQPAQHLVFINRGSVAIRIFFRGNIDPATSSEYATIPNGIGAVHIPVPSGAYAIWLDTTSSTADYTVIATR